MSGIGLVVLVAALALTAVVGGWSRTRNGRMRVPDTAEPATGPAAVLERLGARPAEAALTVVQFSTAFCGPCRATRARLEQLKARHPGLAVVHVDAESELDAVRALDVRRTPTLFFLDRGGRLVGRSSGAPQPEQLTALVAAHAGTPSSGAPS